MKKFLHIFAFCFLLFAFSHDAYAACTFTGTDIRADFDNCNPSIGIESEPNKNFTIMEEKSDFRELTARITRRFQVVASVIAIGMMVWIGLMMVLPVSAEEKEHAKGKIFSVLLGFLVMISASIIVNALINIVYDLFR